MHITWRHVHRQAGANCTDAKLYFGTIFQFFFYPNLTWTHPPTSKLFLDFWNFFNFAKPLSEVSKGYCIIMGYFNHGNIKCDSLQSTGVEDQKVLCLVQNNFLTQHVLEPTRASRVLDIVLSSQKEFVDNVVIQEPLGSSDHNQLHFNINVKSDKTKKLNNVGGILGEVTMRKLGKV